MLVILIIYDCRTCWAGFTFRAHNVHFFSYYCCDKSVFGSVVTCEKAQKPWSDVEFVTSRCSRVSACEFCFPTFCSGLRKGRLDALVADSGKTTIRLHFFPQHHRQRSRKCRSEGKCDCSDQCCSDTHTKNICEHVGIQIYNRFILVCWCEKIMVKSCLTENRKKQKHKRVDSVCCSSTVVLIKYNINSAEQGNSHQHNHTNPFIPSRSHSLGSKVSNPKLPESDGSPESCPVLHVLLPLETVVISESLDSDAYSHFNNVWQPINMAFCIVKMPHWLLFWLQVSHQNILEWIWITNDTTLIINNYVKYLGHSGTPNNTQHWVCFEFINQ